MANKIGPLIKSARTGAGFTQEQLSRKVKSVTASDISKAERGELELSQAVLKEIAKATGVTQKSLLDATAASTYKKTAGSKSTAGKTAAGKTAAKASAASAGTSMKLTAAEKKLVELYRKADADTKKAALQTLRPESGLSGILSSLMGKNASGSSAKNSGNSDLMNTLLGAMNMLNKS